MIVAIVDIGGRRGDISEAVGASLVGAGMLSLLIYPLAATRLGAPYVSADSALPIHDRTAEY